jgi:hypothetical protein
MAWVPVQKPGDKHPKIPAAKKALGKFSYGKNLGGTDEYTVEFGVALIQWQVNIHYQVAFKGRPGPDVTTTGVFDWATQTQMGLLAPPVPEQKPWIITVAGHIGAWDNGPAYWSALPLQQQGRAVVQGVGYDTHTIPFNNKDGARELNRILYDVKPDNVPYAIMAHSQGAIIACDYIQNVILQRPDDPSLKNFRGGVMFGNPRRPTGVVARWITDPPPATSSGIADDCLPAKLPGVEEASRKGDLYADKTPGQAAEYKVAIYRIIARGEFFGGTDSITEQLLELGVSPFTELWPVFQALIGAIGFGINMDSHNIFSLTEPRDHVARVLGI